MDIRTFAARQLADFDRREPGTAFAQPGLSMTLGQAYDVQFQVARFREQRGERVIGYKIGCITPTMQNQLGLDRPVFGHLWDTECRPTGSVIDAADYDGLAIEGEIGVRLGADVPSADWLSRNSAVMVSAFPVIELHHYIFRGSNEIRAAELVANNAIHAGVVMPPAETPLEGDPSRLDRPVRVNRNGELLGRSTGGEHPNGVLSGMVRLAEHLERYGQRLREGQIVLTGSPLPLWRVTAGDHIQVCSDGLSQPAEVVVKERTSETPRPAR